MDSLLSKLLSELSDKKIDEYIDTNTIDLFFKKLEDFNAEFFQKKREDFINSSVGEAPWITKAAIPATEWTYSCSGTGIPAEYKQSASKPELIIEEPSKIDIINTKTPQKVEVIADNKGESTTSSVNLDDKICNMFFKTSSGKSRTNVVDLLDELGHKTEANVNSCTPIKSRRAHCHAAESYMPSKTVLEAVPPPACADWNKKKDLSYLNNSK